MNQLSGKHRARIWLELSNLVDSSWVINATRLRFLDLNEQMSIQPKFFWL